MTLKQQMKWRLNDLMALQALPAGSPERRQAEKRLWAEFTQPCAAEIMGAAADSPLAAISRQRRLWAKLGYALIVVFLVTVAALVLGYWLVSDNRVRWLGKRGLVGLLAASLIEVGLMLLCANRITAIQNRRTASCADAILGEFAALPEADRQLFTRLLGQDCQQDNPDQRVGCCACGALFPFGEVGQPEAFDHVCPRCGVQYQLVFEGEGAPLDGDTLNRLQSFMEDAHA